MFYALSKSEDRLAKSLASASQLDPCTIAVNEGEHIYRDGLFHFQDFGIYNLAGPDWDQSLQTICDNFDDEICEWAGWLTGGAPSSVQNEMHWAQNALEDRYQEYIKNELYRRGHET